MRQLRFILIASLLWMAVSATNTDVSTGAVLAQGQLESFFSPLDIAFVRSLPAERDTKSVERTAVPDRGILFARSEPQPIVGDGSGRKVKDRTLRFFSATTLPGRFGQACRRCTLWQKKMPGRNFLRIGTGEWVLWWKSFPDPRLHLSIWCFLSYTCGVERPHTGPA